MDEPTITIPWWFQPFEANAAAGYRFVMPHVAISGDDVALDFDRDRKQWHLVQEESGHRWEAYGESQPEAVLALNRLPLGCQGHRSSRCPRRST